MLWTTYREALSQARFEHFPVDETREDAIGRRRAQLVGKLTPHRTVRHGTSIITAPFAQVRQQLRRQCARQRRVGRVIAFEPYGEARSLVVRFVAERGQRSMEHALRPECDDGPNDGRDASFEFRLAEWHKHELPSLRGWFGEIDDDGNFASAPSVSRGRSSSRVVVVPRKARGVPFVKLQFECGSIFVCVRRDVQVRVLFVLLECVDDLV